MTASTDDTLTGQAGGGPTKLFQALICFEGPQEEFVPLLLAAQCAAADVAAGAVFALSRSSGGHAILGMHPRPAGDSQPPDWLDAGLKAARVSGPLPAPRVGAAPAAGPRVEDGPGRIVLVPLRTSGEMEEVACFYAERAAPRALPLKLRQLGTTAVFWASYVARRAARAAMADEGQLRQALEVLAAVNNAARFQEAAMGLCNELAARLDCDRVSFGALSGRYVKLRAMSHTEKFSRKSRLAQAIEAAMEECLDQDVEVALPTAPESVVVSRCAEDLSRRHGPAAVLSLPLRYQGEPKAVLTLERGPDAPFEAREARMLRLAADLAAPRLIELMRRDRWFGARAAAWSRRHAALAVGPRHTWAKLAALGGLALVVFLCFARGSQRASATFTLRPLEKTTIAAPFAGFLEAVYVRPGDPVEAGRTLMATLDASELASELAEKEAERRAYVQEANADRAAGKMAEERIAEAKAEQAQASCDLLALRRQKASITAPIDGVVLSGDHVNELGMPVELGKSLFEVAPLKRLEAEMYVAERDIGDLRPGQDGALAVSGYPERKLDFTVEAITPLAEVVNHRNVFRVRASLHERPQWMYPGMEGVAKVDVARRPLIWIWTRRAVNWVRMKLWL